MYYFTINMIYTTTTQTESETMTTTTTTTADTYAADIIIKGRTVTRARVLEVLAECDELGAADFLQQHGYRDAVRFHLRHDGRSYPSKAVLGVAAGLEASEFFGGARGTVAHLGRLGFYVRNSATGEIVDPTLEGLRRDLIAAGLDVAESAWPEPAVTPAAYFLSGSNRPAEIRGLGIAGADVGVAADQLSAAAVAELEALAGSELLVFLDSGAFSEVKFDAAAGGFVIDDEITPAEWQKRLALALHLGRSLGDQLVVVAPDRVGSQDETLARLSTYRDEVAEIAATGARILVAVQRGARTQAAFAAEIDTALDGIEWTPALPCKKAATSPAELADFLAARRPSHIHLLGLGIRNPKLDAYLAPFATSSSSVSLDSCWLAANAGRRNGPANGPRRLTRARDAAAALLGTAGTGAAVTTLALVACLGPAL